MMTTEDMRVAKTIQDLLENAYIAYKEGKGLSPEGIPEFIDKANEDDYKAFYAGYSAGFTEVFARLAGN